MGGEINGSQVVVCHTGVGREHCQRNIERFFQLVRPDFLISSGFAGSLTDTLQVGDLFVAQNFSDRDLTAKVIQAGAAAAPYQFGGSASPGSRELPPEVLPAGLQTSVDSVTKVIRPMTLRSVDRMVDSADGRRRIAQEHAADAIDMETEVIAAACAAHSIPLLSLRVISDSLAAPFPAPPEVLFDLTRQRTAFGKLIPYLVTHPSAVGRLFRFARQIDYARSTLTDALVGAISVLGGNSFPETA